MSTMTNQELMAYRASLSLLTSIEKQRRHILLIEAAPNECPNCGHAVRRWEALGITDVNDYDTTKSHPDAGECPNCQRGISHCVPFTGGWHWSLIPVRVAA